MNTLNSISLVNNRIEDQIKNQIKTREGTYKKLNNSEYAHSKNYNGSPSLSNTNIGVKCSFCNIEESSTDLICFNNSREIYIYKFYGTSRVSEVNLPLDKRIYKGIFPTCHDFNQSTSCSESVELLVGFSTGQIQLFDPFRKELNKFFNGERLVDTEKVTCIKWLPNSKNQFFVSHSSGQLYLYKEDLICDSKSPNYQFFKAGEGYSVYTCKTKTTQNPLFRWIIGEGSLNEFAFSPCGKYLATVSQDGFLRVFDYNTMELEGRLRSYFGGLLCVTWSHDSRLIATGGEDDLVTVWSFFEKRVIAKGRGHKSWVSQVAFDSFTSLIEGFSKVTEAKSDTELSQNNLEDENDKSEVLSVKNNQSKESSKNELMVNNKLQTKKNFINSYRLASVGQDTQLCFWEISDDILKKPIVKSRTSILSPTFSNQQLSNSINLNSPTTSSNAHNFSNFNGKINSVNSNSLQSNSSTNKACFLNLNISNGLNSTISSNSSNFSNKSSLSKSDSKKEHKKSFGLKNQDKYLTKQHQIKTNENPCKLLGTIICPRLEDCVKLEPLVCKKISHERLTSLSFREDCFVVACHDGYVYTWARPGKWNLQACSPSNSLIFDMMDELVNENGSTVV